MESLWEHKETMLLMIFIIPPFSTPVGIMELYALWDIISSAIRALRHTDKSIRWHKYA